VTAAAATDPRVLDEAGLRGLLGQVGRRRGDSRLLIVTAAARWDGPELLDSEAGPVRVVPARSALAVRAALAEHRDEFLAVLTPLTHDELGEEVLARAWGQRAHRPSPWDAVKALFKVDQLDPALRDERWMVDLLVAVAPPQGYLQPAAQLLDRGRAWSTLLRFGLRLAEDPPSTADLLRWAGGPDAVAFARFDAEARRRVEEHLAVIAGPGAVPVLRLAAAGRGGEALALGVAVDALWPDCDPAARILLQERYLDRQVLDGAAAADWGAAAVELVRAGAPADDPDLLHRVDLLLAEVDPQGTADSAVVGRAFSRRLAAVGVALTAALDGGTPRGLPAAVQALDAVGAHVLAAREPARVARAEAALRLCRRVLDPGAATHPATTDTLTDLAAAYRDEGAWVDAARDRIAEGESLPELVAVFERLLDSLDEERRDRDRTFAAAVAQEAVVGPPSPPALDSTRPLPIEHVLGTVVAPIARAEPVLLLVVDGLSHAAAIPLVADLRREGWVPLGPGGQDPPLVMAALPTVTVVSRASLLSGRLQTGGPDVERDGFSSNPALRDATGGQPPLLFHKADLKPAGGEIAPAVREAVADPACRVVGVVVNGVDDHLDKGSQLRLADGLEGVQVLRPLLQAAAEARRVVVLASDHGHVLGAAQRVVPASGGERYRLAGGPPAPDEVEVMGPRVLRGEHRVVAAADATVRYIAVAKHGYHGGVTPAEALCPLVVLTTGGVRVPGWEPLPPRPPAWWDPAAAAVTVPSSPATPALEPPAPPAGRPGRAPARGESQLSLLDPPAPRPSLPSWLDALLASPRLADQRRLAGRAALDDADLGDLLRILVAAGGTASGGALQRTLGLGPSRLRGKLEAARKLLDVDGYQVLRVEPDGTATLNGTLLAQQFEIPVPGSTS